MSTATEIYKAKRKMQEKISLLAVWGGALFLLVDMSTSFPTPARGAYAMWWLLVIGAGGVGWVQSRKLPVEQAIALADEHGGELTIPTMTMELGLPVTMAEKTLNALCECEQAMAIHTGQRSTWLFFNTNAADSRLVRALEMIQDKGAELVATDLVESDIARDLDEAESMLRELTTKGYVKSADTDEAEVVEPEVV